MASNNFLAMEVGFPSSEMLLSSRQVIWNFFSVPLAKRRINAFNSDFVKVVSKSLSKSETLFGFFKNIQ